MRTRYLRTVHHASLKPEFPLDELDLNTTRGAYVDGETSMSGRFRRFSQCTTCGGLSINRESLDEQELYAVGTEKKLLLYTWLWPSDADQLKNTAGTELLLELINKFYKGGASTCNGEALHQFRSGESRQVKARMTSKAATPNRS